MVAARDWLLPPFLATIYPRTQTPVVAQLVFGVITGAHSMPDVLLSGWLTGYSARSAALNLGLGCTCCAGACCAGACCAVPLPTLKHGPAASPRRHPPPSPTRSALHRARPPSAAALALACTFTTLSDLVSIATLLVTFMVANALLFRRYFPGLPRLRYSRWVAGARGGPEWQAPGGDCCGGEPGAP